jgi:ribonuclease-3 family protein
MCPDIEKLDNLSADVDYRALSGLSLAFIGDAVYELFIRKYILSKGEARMKELHKETVRLVNADFQADMTDVLLPKLREDELAVFKRGRNAHAGHTPKNKSEAQYHKSTGFEALIGYLYLKKDFERLDFIFSEVLENE